MDEVFTKRKIFFVLVVSLFVAIISFWPSLNNGFTNWDDDKHLTNNVLVRSLSMENIKAIFRSSINNIYIPFTLLTFAVEYHFFEYSPFIYHLNNLLLHCGVVVLIVLLCLNFGLLLRVSGMAGLLFAVHPMHVESVAWITERKDVLYAFFYMFSLLMYCQYVDKHQKRLYLLSVIFGFLSILAKPMALSLPLIMLLCDWIKGRKFNRLALLDKIPHLFYIIPIAWITYLMHSRFLDFNILKALIIWVWTFSFYIEKFFFPLELNPLYQLPVPVDISSFTYIMAIFIFLLILGVGIWFRRKKWVLFSGLFYFGSIFFLLRFDQKADMNIVADRFMYLPSFGFCILIALGIDRALKFLYQKKRKFFFFGVSIVGLFFVLLGIKSSQQTKVWKNSISLWNHVIELEPNVATPYNNRGKFYLEIGEKDKALIDFNKVIEINPFHTNVYNNRGVLLSSLGKNELAVKDFTNAIELKRDFSQAYFNRGRSYLQMKRFQMAVKDFKTANSLGLVDAKDYLKNLGFKE